jgi:hypothetical protein
MEIGLWELISALDIDFGRMTGSSEAIRFPENRIEKMASKQMDSLT